MIYIRLCALVLPVKLLIYYSWYISLCDVSIISHLLYNPDWDQNSVCQWHSSEQRYIYCIYCYHSYYYYYLHFYCDSATRQCRRMHYVSGLFVRNVRLFFWSDIVNTILLEHLKNFEYSLAPTDDLMRFWRSRSQQPSRRPRRHCALKSVFYRST